MADTIRIDILKDGTVKTTTDPISAENHQSAEAFLSLLASLLGGDVTVEHRVDAHTHQHHHDHAREHNR